MTTPTMTRLYGWTIYPILNDDTGAVDYWDIHEPCDIHDPRHVCECATDLWSQGDYTAATLAEAKAIVKTHSPNGWRDTTAARNLHNLIH